MNGKKATRPCPCGWLGHESGRCRCTAEQVSRYRGKLSGPLLDRIDLCVDVPAVNGEILRSRAAGEASVAVRERVITARDRQLGRQWMPNSELDAAALEAHCRPEESGARLLARAAARLSLSARQIHRVLRVARTIADLAGAERVASAHVAEAVQYRRGQALQ